jgi:hypothetical protein
VVTDDPAVAAAELQRGGNVVLILPSDSHYVAPERDAQSPGRLAILVGDADDEVTQAAAREMHDELFSTRR